MKKFFKWFGISLVAATVLVVVASVLFWKFLFRTETHEWKQKLTVQVETPAGLISGFSVTHVVYTTSPILELTGLSSGHTKLNGEAVVVEILPGKYLFALLKGPTDNYTVRRITHAFSKERLNGKKYQIFLDFYESLKPGDKIILPAIFYPMLVTFTDINDPTSVMRVAPTNLEKHFGAGVVLKEIMLEITDEPVTEGGSMRSWVG